MAKIIFDSTAFSEPKLQPFLRSALWLSSGIEQTIRTGKGESTDFTREKLFNKRLEVGGGLTSKLNSSTGEREYETAFDVRFAPYQIESSRTRGIWSNIWTPLLIEGSISNKKITADTLATNTVHVWSEVNLFKLTPGLPAPILGGQQNETDLHNWNLHRVVIDGGITADRDFHENEYGGRISYWYTPGLLNRFIGGAQLANRQRRLLFDFLPIGIDLAHKQTRRPLPFAPSDAFVRRLRFGAKMAIQFPPYTNLSFEDTFFVRGEDSENRLRHYFKGQVEVIPLDPMLNFSQGFFVSYERGNVPPFATRNLSTWKIGFRMRVRDWQ